jgi:hypothetical protein
MPDWPYPPLCFLVPVSIDPLPQQHFKEPMPHCQRPPTCRMLQVRLVGAGVCVAQLLKTTPRLTRALQPKRACFSRELGCPQSYHLLDWPPANRLFFNSRLSTATYLSNFKGWGQRFQEDLRAQTPLFQLAMSFQTLGPRKPPWQTSGLLPPAQNPVRTLSLTTSSRPQGRGQGPESKTRRGHL